MAGAQRLTLAAAMVLALAWLAWPSPERPSTANTAVDQTPTVWAAWDLEPDDWPGLIDGAAWTPLSFLDEGTALGTDEAGRLLYVESGEELTATVLAEPGGSPGIAATAASDDAIAWIQSTPDEAGQVVSELWTAPRDPDGRPGEAELLTTDTGDVITAGSAYDLQFAAEGLHWLATARDAERVTEHRSIPTSGGEVEVVGHRGAWQAAAWPWLASAGSDSLGGAELVRTDTGAGVKVTAGTDELAMCSASWCRLVVTTDDGSRVDLVRSDGTDRTTVAEGFTSAVSADAGLIDRFEPLQESNATTGDGTKVTLFDLDTGETYLVASAAGQTGAVERHLWWSTGTEELLVWHVLDLTDLA
ncbi:hypothetical protein [Glycomyces buryatensis]|uniref:WD40 repeat domain-containing protein n=1 Tax=Glycomyces buryatensis TaxID=2570927 RepID=A0A4S8QKG4_9ACTN|nr:hypothetical protein [Glycomyces buryatensis]THV41234.1 hypothetical protein FAB82_12435 [Glycomyces buryatensis]